jgi:hypothetical protein
MYRTATDISKAYDKDFAYQRIRDAITDWDWTRSTAQAYVEQIFQTLLAAKSWRFDKPETIEPYLAAANLPLDIELERALSNAWKQSSYTRCQAADEQVLDTIHKEGYADAKDSHLLFGIIQRLGKENNWTRNLRGTQELHEQQRIQRRQRLIQIIGDGRATYPIWKAEYGQFRYSPVEHLENESDEMLEALASRVPAWRNQIADYNSASKAQPQVEEGVLLTTPAQKHIAEQADEFLAHPEHPEREYTAQELKRMSRAEMNQLLFIRGQSRGLARRNAVNRVLAAKQFGE